MVWYTHSCCWPGDAQILYLTKDAQVPPVCCVSFICLLRFDIFKLVFGIGSLLETVRTLEECMTKVSWHFILLFPCCWYLNNHNTYSGLVSIVKCILIGNISVCLYVYVHVCMHVRVHVCVVEKSIVHFPMCWSNSCYIFSWHSI